MQPISRQINRCNDSTFNVVLSYKCYPNNKFCAIVKNGGIFTKNSVGQPIYRIATNMDGDEPHVFDCDNLEGAVDFAEQYKNEEIKSGQRDAKKDLEPLLGTHIYLSPYVLRDMISQIRENINEFVEEANRAPYHKCVDVMEKFQGSLPDKAAYNCAMHAFDKLHGMVYKLEKERGENTIAPLSFAVSMYNNLMGRY